MKCQICGERDATLSIKQVTEGDVKEMHICQECASVNGISPENPLSLTDVLFGIGMQKASSEAARTMLCGSCGMSLEDFRKDSLLGCPDCYKAFFDEIAPMLKEWQGGLSHKGKVPATARLSADLEDLTQQLNKAVEEQRFEDAATLRDMIHDLKTEHSTPVPSQEASA